MIRILIRFIQKAKLNLQKLIDEKILIQESTESIYLYSQKFEDHVQYGVVAICVMPH